MADARTLEIQENYRYFQTVVSDLMKSHAGMYALLHSQTLVEVFPKPLDAMIEGRKRYSDGVFSVQMVTDRPVDLGFLSNAADNGITA